jgi:hypothetical protein
VERFSVLAGGGEDADRFPERNSPERDFTFAVVHLRANQSAPRSARALLARRFHIKTDRETVMNFMRGLADGMDFYRDERNRETVIKYLGEFYKSNNAEELEETWRVYTQGTPGLPVITIKAMENMISSDRILSTMNINSADMMDLSFLKQLEEERKTKR